MELIRKIKFRKIRNKGIKLIKESNKTMTPTGKTSNIYRLTKEQYEKLIMNSMTSTNKKVNNNIKEQINMSGKNLLRDR